MKKGFTLVELIGVIIILGMIAVLAFPPLLSMINEANSSITEANQVLLLSAADQYTNKYKNDFPIYQGNTYCITYGDLIKEELIPSRLTNKGGEIIDYNTKIKVVIDENLKPQYELNNACEIVRNDPQPLVNILLAQYSASNTTGLLKDDTGYYYKGTNTEVSNNFVWFAGHLWRVISIDNDDNLTMITQQPLTTISPANVAWANQTQYEASYINHWLNDETDGVFYKSLDSEDKAKILDSTFNVGTTTNISGITSTGKVGLLDVSQYIKARDFLGIDSWFWLGNRDATSDDYLAIVDSSGQMHNKAALLSNSYGVRPVIKISSFSVTVGDGTLSNPYRKNSITSSTTNIKIGEYISIPTTGTDCGSDKRCLFRVVSKDSNSVKVTLNGILSNSSAFDSNVTTTYTSGNTVDTKVTTFASTINNNYRYTGNKTFGIGGYNHSNYTSVYSSTYTGNVGLPVVGEMFTSFDIANESTRENVSGWFWTMNNCANGTFNVNRVGTSGKLEGYRASNENSVRPVLFLKNNLNFTGGEGTAENPFTLE